MPARFARLIANCTRHNQVERWDFSQILTELERLYEIISHTEIPVHGDLLTEELISRAIFDSLGSYSVNQGTGKIDTMLPSGTKISATPNDSTKKIDLDVQWFDSGAIERKNVGKYVNERMPAVVQQLTSSGWEVNSKMYSAGTLGISLSISYFNVSKSMQLSADGLKHALDKLALR